MKRINLAIYIDDITVLGGVERKQNIRVFRKKKYKCSYCRSKRFKKVCIIRKNLKKQRNKNSICIA